MANKLLFLVFLQLVYGILCQQSNANNLNYPIDCVGDEVYPWFEGCDRYLQCNAGKAALTDCPENPSDKLEVVCPGSATPAANCGYSACTPATTNLVAFVAPNATITSTSYYAMCIKGVIVRQSRCRSDNPDLMLRFDPESQQCALRCEDGYVIPGADCTSYTVCVDNSLMTYRCPRGSLFDGERCTFTKTTC